MLLAHEVAAPIKDGVLWPSVIALYAAMAMQSEFNGRMLEIDPRAGGRFGDHAAVVAGRFRQSGHRRRLIERYMRSGTIGRKTRISTGAADLGLPRHRIRQPPRSNTKNSTAARRSIVKQNVYRNFDFKRATALVDRALNLPPLEK